MANAPSGPAAARPGLILDPTPATGAPQPLPYGAGPVAFPEPVTPPFQQNPGHQVNQGQPWLKKFIPPLALFNDAAQWVNKKFFVRPMPWQQAPDSLPPLHAQYFTPPPIESNRLAAGMLNLQTQLGSISIQVQQLTQDATNFHGGS